MTPLATKREELAAKQKHLHAIFEEAKTDNAADRGWALQDAANEEAAGWRDVTAKHAAVLTMLAIAVYLFRLSLTVKLRINRTISSADCPCRGYC